MKKMSKVTIVLLITGLLLISPALGRRYQFETFSNYSLNGIDLEAGRYELRLHPTKTGAVLYDRGLPLTSVDITVESLDQEGENTVVVHSDRRISEYRSSDMRIIFAE